MKISKLRDELDKLIESGKSDWIVYYNDGASGLEEIIDVKEDFNNWDGNHVQLI